MIVFKDYHSSIKVLALSLIMQRSLLLDGIDDLNCLALDILSLNWAFRKLVVVFRLGCLLPP